MFTLLIGAIIGLILNRKDLIRSLLIMELILLIINYDFLLISIFIDDINGLIISIFLLTIAATESTIGLALIIIYFKIKGTSNIQYLNLIGRIIWQY